MCGEAWLQMPCSAATLLAVKKPCAVHHFNLAASWRLFVRGFAVAATRAAAKMMVSTEPPTNQL
eukprot:CAMPEP_0170607966 /NCGR_PEP_ID=MMETSP0224-20130122/21336_1 /TAXON_ID=285029 /ORGANISM="Togula jolla, Strain CCCM 725" /LENGTH=63 /DNA_ID=CAMNT_0010933167 /DNA_START=60 /DNA_END=247 /DNA_ORIENTATION=+